MYIGRLCEKRSWKLLQRQQTSWRTIQINRVPLTESAMSCLVWQICCVPGDLGSKGWHCNSCSAPTCCHMQLQLCGFGTRFACQAMLLEAGTSTFPSHLPFLKIFFSTKQWHGNRGATGFLLVEAKLHVQTAMDAASFLQVAWGPDSWERDE